MVEMSQRCWRARKAHLGEHRGAGCSRAGTGITELFRRRWHLPSWGEAMCSASWTLHSCLGLTLTLLFVIQDVPEAVCHTVQFSTGMDFAREDFRPTWTSNRGTLVKKKDQKQVGKSKGVPMG